jgi:Domain of unknown function (DUF4248)
MALAVTYTELKNRYGVSSKRFKRMINPIIDELENAGYRNGQRIFTPKQLKIIYEYLE